MARLRYLQNARTGTAGTISKDTKPIQFYDDDMYIYASADGVLEIVSDTTLTLTAPTINVTSSTVTAYTYPISITYNCTASNVSDLTITSVSSSTSGSVVIKPLYVDATMSATGGLGRAIEGKLLVSGKLGDYGNAIKGYTDLTGGTGCAGLVSAICAEMKMPASTALGTHAVLEIELVMPTSAVIQQGVGSNCTSFIRVRVSDNSTAVQSFNDYGYLLDLQGLTSATTDLFDGCTLKCAIGSTKYYLLLSTATASFTTAYPIVSTSTAAITLSGTATADHIAITGTWGAGITYSAISIGDYSTALALPETSNATVAHWIGQTIHLSADIGQDFNVIPFHAKFTTTGDCASGTVAQAVYGRVDVAHNLIDAYGIRGHIAISGAPEVGQMFGVFATLATTACTLLTAGNIAGVGVLVEGTADITQGGTYGKLSGMYIAWKESHAMAVDTCGVYIGNFSGMTLDDGFRINSVGDTTNAFHSEQGGGTVVTGLRLTAAHTNAFAFPAIGTAPCESYTAEEAPTGKIKILVGTQVRYLAYWD